MMMQARTILYERQVTVMGKDLRSKCNDLSFLEKYTQKAIQVRLTTDCGRANVLYCNACVSLPHVDSLPLSKLP